MSLSLPEVRIPDRMTGGRNARRGYQRGWGLQFGGLGDRIVLDPVFLRAGELARGRTVVDLMRLMNIFLIIRFFFPKLSAHDIVEFGAYRGGSAMFMASCLKDLFPLARVYALDTFAGMPPTGELDMHKPGDFRDTSFDEVQAAARRANLTNLTFVKGRFAQSFPPVAANAAAFGLAHIDCDIYDAVRYCQDAVWPKMCAGGYVVYDDATTSSCLGATQAVEELIIERRLHSEQVWPHVVLRAGLTQ